MALSLMFTLSILLPAKLKAQSVSINQQQQNININVPVIEKPVYIERYRTVYVDKPRVARKLDKPVLLLGYLWVYPEDLGNFKQVPVSVINSVNAQKPYGRDNWRIPTPDELAVLEANADKIGLGDDIYLATDHRNGVLRLVSTGQTNADYFRNAVSTGQIVAIGNLYFRSNPINREKIIPQKANDYIQLIPDGWRLPTEDELYNLMKNYNATYLFDMFSQCGVKFGAYYKYSSGGQWYCNILCRNVMHELSYLVIKKDMNNGKCSCWIETDIPSSHDTVFGTGEYVFVLPVYDH